MKIHALKSRVLALCAAVVLSGCPDDPIGPAANGTSLPGPTAAQALSEGIRTEYTDIAVGSDGTIHLVFQEPPASGRTQIFYRSSTDGGATWSTALNLSEPDRDRTVGFVRLLVDPTGRAYAIWKALDDVHAGAGDFPNGDLNNGTLCYRVLNAGTWSPIVEVGEKNEIGSWFPSLSPDGKAFLVWSEPVTWEPGKFTNRAPVVRQAELGEKSAAAPQTVIAAVTSDGQPATFDNVPSYSALSGYVDAAHKVHFIAAKILSTAGTLDINPSDLVKWDGAKETKVLEIKRYMQSTAINTSPPHLLVDSDGQEHLILLDMLHDTQRVIEWREGGEPRVLHTVTNPQGNIPKFQAMQGPRGQLAIMSELNRSKALAPYELVVSQLGADKAWGPARQVTTNADKETVAIVYDESSTVGSTTRHSTDFAAGAVDAEGRLHLALVASEVNYVSGTGTAADGDVFQSGMTSRVKKPWYLKL